MNAPRVPRRGRLAVAVAALALVLSACAGAAPPGGGAAAPPAPGTAAAAGALDFTGGTVDGGTFDASTLAGTPVVLWFWSPF